MPLQLPVEKAGKLRVEAAAHAAVAAQHDDTVPRSLRLLRMGDAGAVQQPQHIAARLGIRGKIPSEPAEPRVFCGRRRAHRGGELSGAPDAFQPLAQLL